MADSPFSFFEDQQPQKKRRDKWVRFKGLKWYILERLKRGYNVLVLIDGDTGTGKSSGAISLLHYLSVEDNIAHQVFGNGYRIKDQFFSYEELKERYLKPFVPEEQVLFNAGSVLGLVKNVLTDERYREYWRGRWVFFDEAGQGLSVWQSAGFQEFMNMLDTFRKYQINMVFTVPVRAEIPPRVMQNHIHVLIWVSARDDYSGKIYGKYRIRYRWEEGVWFVRPRSLKINLRNFAMKFVGTKRDRERGDRLVLKFAPDDLWERYERFKDNYIINYQLPSAIERINRLFEKSGLLINRDLVSERLQKVNTENATIYRFGDVEINIDELKEQYNLEENEYESVRVLLQALYDFTRQGFSLYVDDAFELIFGESLADLYTKEERQEEIHRFINKTGLSKYIEIRGQKVVLKK